jgi:MFS family permease
MSVKEESATRKRSSQSIEFVERVQPAHSVPAGMRVIDREDTVPIDDPPGPADQADHNAAGLLLHPTISLPLLNMIDMFAVSLVVPLLFQYYKHAGVTNASHRELLSSVFSVSQIVGGLLLGAMADAGVIQRRTILFLSFLGSAVAYALIVFGGLNALIFSRVLVGLVKQTMTVTTTLIARYTTKNTRAKHMGRLSASSTAAWIAGPSVGAVLYSQVDHRAPAILACALFIVNTGLAALLLPAKDAASTDGSEASKSKSKSETSFMANLQTCFSSRALGSVVASLLLVSWFTRATSYATMASYYEQMYGMEPHHRGYLSSYQSILSLVIQSFLVGPLMTRCGGERRAACYSALLLSTATLLELQRSLPFYLIVLCPAISLSVAMLGLSLQSLVTHVTPKESLGSVLAALDVLQNATAVTVPFYRTMLFAFLGPGGDGADVAMVGDPDPVSACDENVYVFARPCARRLTHTVIACFCGDVWFFSCAVKMSWVASSSVHWALCAFAMSYFLLSSDRQATLGGGKKGF